ncbi:MAG: adenylate/guanylate cyclase domain-containing protein [Alphaproteobacteria bacterium]|nr:adenylate/guanylate cyclase domain-containing protein [Alphaproteobacteria bacterium]
MTGTPRIGPEQVQAISDWLIEAALATVPLSDLVEGFCERLNAAGMALRRVSVGARVLHPTHDSRTVRWIRGVGLERLNFETGGEATPQWLDSPIRVVLEAPGQIVRRRLDAAAADRDFPILDELKAEGDTDYVALATYFDAFGRPGSVTGTVVTWSTDRPGGFDDGEISTIERLQPRFAVAVKCAVLPQIAEDVVGAYLGADAGHRVLGGAIDRGAVDVLAAILFFCDLRGFTALADRMDLKDLIALLDSYFDAIVTPIGDNGGQVLKFMGDGLLATFAITEADTADVCDRALTAATKAFAEIDSINAARAAEGMPTLTLDIALHRGEVSYGNVGSRDRLDFTVIGPAVNEASRMEDRCDELGVDLVLSETFVAAAGPGAAAGFVSLGRHGLRGVGAPRELFTLKDRPRHAT